MKRGDIDHHDIPGILPGADDDQRDQRGLRVRQHQVVRQELDADDPSDGRDELIEDVLPDVTEDDSADDIGQEEPGAIDIASFDLRRHQHRQGERDDVNQNDVGKRINRSDDRRIKEGGVFERFHIVRQADEIDRGLCGRGPVGKRVIHPDDKRDDLDHEE